MGGLEGFVWGAIGGALAELLGWFRLRHQAPANLPVWFSHKYYWFCTSGMVVAGGVLCVAYLKSGFELKPIVAINVGASAPLLLGSFVSQSPPVEPGRIN
jgi:hypothetical protein